MPSHPAVVLLPLRGVLAFPVELVSSGVFTRKRGHEERPPDERRASLEAVERTSNAERPHFASAWREGSVSGPLVSSMSPHRPLSWRHPYRLVFRTFSSRVFAAHQCAHVRKLQDSAAGTGFSYKACSRVTFLVSRAVGGCQYSLVPLLQGAPCHVGATEAVDAQKRAFERIQGCQKAVMRRGAREGRGF